MDPHFSQFATRLRPSAIRALTKAMHGRKVISFAGGLPHPDAFPGPELAALAKEALETRPAEMLQYGLTQGYPPLIEQVMTYLAGRGIAGLKPENLLICSGSQQALDIAGRLFIDPGDVVLVENPGYVGALSAFEHLGARLVGVHVREDGPDLEEMERLARTERPKFFYFTANFANPSGVLASAARRRAIYDLARRYDFWILEDDAYGELFFAETSPAEVIPAKAHDPDERILYLTTFSKTIAPGLRVAVMAGSAQVISRVELTKQTADMFTGVLPQFLVCEFLRRGLFAKRLPALRSLYQAKRDALDLALREHLPEARWNRPKGGFFIWLEFPGGLDAEALLKQAMEAGVAFVPGSPFCFGEPGEGRSAARLAFSREPETSLAEGVRILGEVAGALAGQNLR